MSQEIASHRPVCFEYALALWRSRSLAFRSAHASDVHRMLGIYTAPPRLGSHPLLVEVKQFNHFNIEIIEDRM